MVYDFLFGAVSSNRRCTSTARQWLQHRIQFAQAPQFVVSSKDLGQPTTGLEEVGTGLEKKGTGLDEAG